MDLFVLSNHEGFLFPPQMIVVDGVFLICCEMQKRGGGVPQRARASLLNVITTEQHSARGEGGRGRGGFVRGKGGGGASEQLYCLAVRLCGGGREVSKLHSAEEDGGGLSVTSSYVSLCDSF